MAYDSAMVTNRAGEIKQHRGSPWKLSGRTLLTSCKFSCRCLLSQVWTQRLLL